MLTKCSGNLLNFLAFRLKIRTRSMLEVTIGRVPTSTRSSTKLELSLEGSTADSEDQTPLHSPVMSRLSTFSRKLSLRRSQFRRGHRVPEVAVISSSPLVDIRRSASLKTSAEREVMIGTSESMLTVCNQTASGTGDVINSDTVDSHMSDMFWLKTPHDTSNRIFDLQCAAVAPPVGEFATYKSRVTFQLDASAESDTDREEDDVTLRTRPASLLRKESHPSKDQVIRRVKSANESRGIYNAAIAGRLENCSNVTNRRVNFNSLRTPPRQRSNSPDSGNSFQPLRNNANSLTPDRQSNVNKRQRNGTTIGHIELCRPRPSSALRKEIKAAKQLGVIMGVFTVCFLPYFVCFTVVAFCPRCVSAQLMTWVTWVGYLNSTLNPILYPLCNANFRRKLRQMLQCMTSSRRSVTTFTGNSIARSPCACAS